MGITRRRFVERGTVALTAFLPLRNALAKTSQTSRGTGLNLLPKTVASDPVFFLTKSQFASRINDSFGVQFGANKLVMSLAAVRDSGPKPPTEVPGKECFSLLFRGPRGIVLPQGSYRFTDSRLGTY